MYHIEYFYSKSGRWIREYSSKSLIATLFWYFRMRDSDHKFRLVKDL